MTSPFDGLQKAVFDATSNLFGYSASWTPANGGDLLTAKVHFKNPTEEVRLAGVQWSADEWTMEYFEEDFTGLKSAVDKRNSKEKVTIGDSDFWVRKIEKNFDGKTYVASLQPVDE